MTATRRASPADDDGLDIDRVTQRTVDARSAPAPGTAAARSVFDVARPPKRQRVTAPPFDPLAIPIKKGVPIPKSLTGVRAEQGARYQALLDRMKAGDSVELPPILARGLQSYAKAKASSVQLSLRKMSADLVGVWRIK